MPWRSICVFVALFVLANAQSDRANYDHGSFWGTRRVRDPQSWSWKHKNPSDNFIDIDLETERSSAADQAWQDQEMSGSGSGMHVTDDEDLLASGSGSGDGVPHFPDKSTSKPTVVITTTPAPTTSTPGRRLTPCQQLHEASQHLSGNYVPHCDANGDYAILQCHSQRNVSHCWCADLQGQKIPGTALTTGTPDCVEGTNLPLCIFQLVGQMRMKVMSTVRRRCTKDGNFERRQCEGSMCHCVDPLTGDVIEGTTKFRSHPLDCDEAAKPGKDGDLGHRITLFPPGPRTTPRASTDMPTKVNINLDDKGDKKDSDDDSRDVDSNDTGDDREPVKEPSSAASMMTQPGILAAIIGGSVVLLLCAILLAMFIIYRMKKKDEGSYPLDEPKKMPNYSYQRAPEKEFYA